MTVTTVSTAAGLVAAVRAAQAGDVIRLAAGDYAALTLRDVSFAAPVTITSEDPASPATLHGLSIYGARGLTFRNLTLVSHEESSNVGTAGHVVQSSSSIAFEKVWFHGSLNGDPHDDTGGLLIRDATDVSVTASAFEQLYWGIGHLDSARLTFSGNVFHDIRMDGVRGGGSDDVVVSGNMFRDFYLKPGDHGDAIQFWTGNTTEATRNVTVTGNVYIRGAGDPVQGIFIADEARVGYDNVTIRGNLILGGIYHGITVGAPRGAVVEDNWVQGFAGQRSWIFLDVARDAQVLNNTTSEMRISASSTNVVQAGTSLLPLANDKGAAALAHWLGANPTLMSLTGGAGDDVLLAGATSAQMRGMEGDDLIRGGSAFDDLNGNQGSDTVSGGAGNDWVMGGKDDDLLFGDEDDDIVYGNLGNDTSDGGDGADTVRGGQGDDRVWGGAGDDWLSGDRGSDTLTGGAGADTFHSFTEAGLDVVTDFDAAQGDRVQLAPGTGYSVSQVGDDTVVQMAGARLVLLGVALETLPAGWIFSG